MKTFSVVLIGIISYSISNYRPLDKSVKTYFSYFSTKTYVVGIQKNCLNETVLLSIQNKW